MSDLDANQVKQDANPAREAVIQVIELSTAIKKPAKARSAPRL